MQQTRQQILEILHERGDATVDELVSAITERISHEITAVTVRHHLDILRSEELVTAPLIRHRSSPGRPQHVFGLTEKALAHFPNNYQNLADNLLKQIKATLPSMEVNVILERMADHMVASAGTLSPSLEARLDQVVHYLSEQGYDAAWEKCAEGFILRTRNCPYRAIAHDHGELCGMDSRLVAGLVGIVPRRLGRIAEDNESCDYLIPVKQFQQK
jgi:DeoR family suf operon transcriptional repressor